MRTLILLAALPLAAHAEPLVTGFERFHQQAPSADAGRLLFNELGCVNCHGGDTGLPARRGPILAGVTQREHAAWLKAFIADPAKVKPGTNMPHLLNDEASAEAVLHYLGTVTPKTPFKPKGAKYMNAERGSDVFHTVGCVTCHQPGKDFQPPAGVPAAKDYTHRSVALPELTKKYSLASLTNFLSDPLKLRPDGRMPAIELHEGDVTDLAAFLLDLQQSDGSGIPGIAPFKADKALAEKGKTLVASMRCAACHELPKDVAAKPVALKQNDGGCLDGKAAGVPRYDLSEAQRMALKSYFAARDEKFTAKQKATLTLQALNCTACHDHDGLGGPDAARKAYFTGDHNLGDTGLYPPPLTEAGRKLTPVWINEVLAGKKRARPYLQTKMPRFGKTTDELAALLAEADAKPEKPLPEGDIAAGQKLMGTVGGIGCITCHRWDKRPSLGIQALDLSTLAQRIQPDWLRDYLINPASHRAGTLMPSFWPNGVASNQVILGGDTDKQIASIYAFTKAGKGEPEGFPAMLAGEFELIPKDRPIIQRTFMKDVGTHAILVGFPAGIHIAYDGLHAQPAMIWKGKFFDAYNTWFTRAAPFESPLGELVARWSEPSASADDVQFRGFKLDTAKVPTFLYDVAKVRVQERFEPKDGKLQRALTWDATARADIGISHPDGVTVTEAPDSAAGHRTFIYSWK